MKPTTEELLQTALTALNTARRFKVPALSTDSYAIAAQIDRHFAEQKRPSMNTKRAAWANAALWTFIEQTGTDREDALGDLLCDLMHWADHSDFDFTAALDRARDHYQAELVEDA